MSKQIWTVTQVVQDEVLTWSTAFRSLEDAKRECNGVCAEDVATWDEVDEERLEGSNGEHIFHLCLTEIF